MVLESEQKDRRKARNLFIATIIFAAIIFMGIIAEELITGAEAANIQKMYLPNGTVGVSVCDENTTRMGVNIDVCTNTSLYPYELTVLGAINITTLSYIDGSPICTSTNGYCAGAGPVDWTDLQNYPTSCASLGNDYTVSIIDDTLTCVRIIRQDNPTTCPTGNYSYWNGSKFLCGNLTAGGGSGDIEGVLAGTGLTDGGTTGTVTLNANTTYLQRRVNETCPVGESIRVINENGSVTCEADSVGSDTNNYPTSVEVNNTGVTAVIEINRTGLSSITDTFTVGNTTAQIITAANTSGYLVVERDTWNTTAEMITAVNTTGYLVVERDTWNTTAEMQTACYVSALYTNITNLQTSNTSAWTNINGLYANLTSVNSTLQANVSALNSNKSGTGTASCAAGTVAQNITLGTGAPTVQCVSTSAGSGNITGSNATSGWPAVFTSTSNIAASYINISYTYGWPAECPAPYYLVGLSNGSSTCALINTTNMTGTGLSTCNLATEKLAYNTTSGVWSCQTDQTGAATSGGNISSENGAAGYIPYFTNSTNINNSNFYQDSSNRLLVGTTSADTGGTTASLLQVEKNGQVFITVDDSSGAAGSGIWLRGGTNDWSIEAEGTSGYMHIDYEGTEYARINTTHFTAQRNISAAQINTTNITVTSLNAASCDVKSTTTGGLYCGTDATTADGNNYPTSVEVNVSGVTGTIEVNRSGLSSITDTFTVGNTTAEMIAAVNTTGYLVKEEGNITGNGTANRVAVFNGVSTINYSTNFRWDATNNRLSIGPVDPSTSLHIGTGEGMMVGTGAIPSGYNNMFNVGANNIVMALRKTAAGTGHYFTVEDSSVNRIFTIDNNSMVIVNSTGNYGGFNVTDSAKRNILFVNPITTNVSTSGNITLTGSGINDCIYMPGGGRMCGNSTCIVLYSPNGLTKVQACN